MKTFLTTLIALFTFNAFAITWQEIETDTKINLNKEVFFEKEGFKIPPQTKFVVEDFYGLPQINVSLIQLTMVNCKFPEVTTEMILASDENGEAVVGLQLGKNCRLEVFVENRDLDKNSIFDLGK